MVGGLVGGWSGGWSGVGGEALDKQTSKRPSRSKQAGKQASNSSPSHYNSPPDPRQLLHLYIPLAAMQLGLVTLFFEPLGLFAPTAKTVIGYPYSPSSVAAILVSAVLGLLVNLSTFLVIGATSSLTYNVVGHIKTVIILSGGVVFFGDSMSGKKFLGIVFAMGGIVWYSTIKLRESWNGSKAKAATTLDRAENGLTNSNDVTDKFFK